MATLLFRLRHVPDDEADGVRALLDEHGIDYYETEPGNWGISMPALWLRDASQVEQAAGLLREYQQQRSERVQQEYAALRERGEAPTLLSSLRAQPLRFVFYTGMSGAILYLSVSSFFSL